MNDAGALYETLARFQWLRRRWSRAGVAEGLEMRKRLQPPVAPSDGPADGAAGLDRWLFAQVGERRSNRVLDLGCGFGISAQRWATFCGGSAVGITPSAFQVARAAEVANAAQLGARCRFSAQSLEAPLPGPFDVVLAIEALGHTTDLLAVLRNVRDALAPGGVFVWLEDLLVEPRDGDEDTAELARRWFSPPLRSVAAARRELAAAGLTAVREIDLTGQVPVAPIGGIRRRTARLRALRTVLPLPPARRLIDAFLGGLALERLYARGAACYRVCMSERRPEVV